MPRTLKITRPRARLEANIVTGPAFSRGFVLTGYETRRTNGRWWHRIAHGADNQWLRLSGREGTSPEDTWRIILSDRARPLLSLSVLVLADFVAHAADSAEPDAWWLFHWVTWGLEELFQLYPPPVSTTAGLSMSVVEIDAAALGIAESLIDGTNTIAWPASDGDQLQSLAALGAYLWSFPPDLVRRLIQLTIDTPNRSSATARSAVNEISRVDRNAQQRAFAGPGIFAQLSGVHVWRTDSVSVRGLPIHTSSFYFLKVIQQALVLNDPDAPLIDNTYLARLCDRALLNLSPEPFGDLSQSHDLSLLTRFSRTTSQGQIAEWSRKSSGEAITHPTLLEYTTLPDSSLFAALELRTIRLVSLPEGLWVRLFPEDGSWGRVFWWFPNIEPPDCVPFALGIEREHPLVWVVHEALWMVWRDLLAASFGDVV